MSINWEEFGFRKGFDPENRFIKQEEIYYKGKYLYVSTVDLGLDHSFMSDIPLYYETMIFQEPSRKDVYQFRYSTEEEARAGHQKVLTAIQDGTLEELEGYYD